MNPKVSIIFVNYKTPKMTSEAILSVKEKTKDTSYEIIVVDNSCDEKEYKELVNTINDNNILIIDAKENLGFGKANNLGAKYAKGKYLLFLNTDTLLINDAISILADFLDKNDSVGVVGPNIYDRNNRPYHSFIKFEKNIKTIKRKDNLFYYLKRLVLKKRNDFNYTNNSLKIDGYICGACLMIRSTLFIQLNGFDKDIFMYAEETLLCHQVINKSNYKIYNIPQAKIIHFEGGSFKEIKESNAKFIIDGNYIYFKKAYNEDTAKCYLKKYHKIIRLKITLLKLIKDKGSKINNQNLKNAIEKKAKEVGVKL